MAGLYFPLFRRLLAADAHGIFTPGTEGTAGSWIEGVRRRTADIRQPRVVCGVQPGNGLQQAPSIGVGTVIEDLISRARFHYLAGIHDRNAVGIGRHYAQVVGNQYDRAPHLLL